MTSNTDTTKDCLSDLRSEVGECLIVVVYIELVCTDVAVTSNTSHASVSIAVAIS
jgi:hypothetical protein